MTQMQLVETQAGRNSLSAILYRRLDYSLEEGSRRKSLQRRSVSIAFSWVNLQPKVGVNRQGLDHSEQFYHSD